jgi:hypothetical protein
MSYKNNVKAAIHQTAIGLYEAGVIDKQTMRDFDASCLTAIQDFGPDERVERFCYQMGAGDKASGGVLIEIVDAHCTKGTRCNRIGLSLKHK